VLLLIEDRDPEPPEKEPSPRPHWAPNWRVWRWVAVAGIVAFAAANTSGALSTLLVFTAFALCCRSLTEAVPYGDGLHDWRQ
jgi:hypothetical protein